jgi:integrin beta 3
LQQADLEAMAREFAPVVKELIAATVAPLLVRIAALEAREPVRGEKGEDGRDGKDGAGITLSDVAPMIQEEIAKVVASLPAPEKGRDGTDGKDGNSVTVDDVAPMIAAEVGKAVAAIPVPKDGRNGLDGKNGSDGKDGIDGRDGEDGVALAGALIDRAGELVLTLSDGTTRELGPVIGSDGKDGLDGRDGEPGRDGIGPDDLEEEIEGEVLVRRWKRAGEVVKEFRHPIASFVDKGVWREGEYRKGNGVTWGGSYWIAQRDTSDKPETSDAWRLAVKRGRDGKDGKAAVPEPVKVKVPV